MRPTPRARHNLFSTSSGIYTRLQYETADLQSIDLSQYSASMYIRTNAGSKNFIYKITNNLNEDLTGIDMSSANIGIIDIRIAPISSSNLPNESYYSLDVYSGSYYVGLLEGKIIN